MVFKAVQIIYCTTVHTALVYYKVFCMEYYKAVYMVYFKTKHNGTKVEQTYNEHGTNVCTNVDKHVTNVERT